MRAPIRESNENVRRHPDSRNRGTTSQESMWNWLPDQGSNLGFLLPEAANAGRCPAENYVRIRRNVAGEYPVCRRKADARWLGLLNPTC